MFARSLPLARGRARRAHYLFAASLFGILGFHVGVWAVQLAPLSAGLGLDPAALGIAVTVAAAAGLITLFAGGALANRVGRRPVLVIGFAGTGTAFVLLALVGSFATLVPAVMLYGLAVSFVDLGANTVGSAYEQAHATTAMTGLHAWFSAGAVTGAIGSAAALHAGISYRGVYLALAAVMAAGLLAALFAASPAPPVPALPAGTTPGRQPPPPADPRVWRIPAVLFAIALISVPPPGCSPPSPRRLRPAPSGACSSSGSPSPRSSPARSRWLAAPHPAAPARPSPPPPRPATAPSSSARSPSACWPRPTACASPSRSSFRQASVSPPSQPAGPRSCVTDWAAGRCRRLLSCLCLTA